MVPALYGALVVLKALSWSSPANFIGSAAQYASQGQFKLDVLNYLVYYYTNQPVNQFVIVFKFQEGTNAEGTEQSLSTDGDETTLHVECLTP